MTSAECGDAELVERARGGEVEAFEALVRRYLRPALALAWESSGSRDDAEDVVQDAFLRALLALPSFDVTRPFAPWFFTILRNASRSSWRRAARHEGEALPETVAGSVPDPLTALEMLEWQAQLEAGLESLPVRQRACFRLCDLEGFSGPEAADMLGLAEGTVRTHLHRARQSLRRTLGPLKEGTTT